MSCRWNGTDQPRTITDRHGEDCPGEVVTEHEGGPQYVIGCRGCQPCTTPHCRVCGVTHVLTTEACPDCLDEARTNLDEILRMCHDLPSEATHRGVEGEAFVLLGPVANAEARQHWEASVLAGRITPMECDAHDLDDVARWLETADDERHPLLVIGTWSMVYRDAFEHDEPTGRIELANEIGYLGRNLTYMGGFEWVPFEDFVRDLRRCAGHLQAVLHDQERGERANVACFDCGGDLERMLGPNGFDDRWTCRGRGCGRRYTIAEYNFALRAALEASA